MNILIKDIFGKERPMPQDGYIDIRLHFYSGRIESATMQTGTSPFYAMFKVVEVPPHGRLGDLDALVKILEQNRLYYVLDIDDESFELGIDKAISIVKEAPTIIEAED